MEFFAIPFIILAFAVLYNGYPTININRNCNCKQCKKSK